MKHMPNLISCLRIFLAVSLLFLRHRPVLFGILYLLCGISDLLDGWLARRYHLESSLGARLDSLGDLAFFGAALYTLFRLLDTAQIFVFLYAVLGIAVLRIVNFIIMRVKFRQWNVMMHTLANKATGLALFFTIPICVISAGIPMGLAVPLGILALLASLEETALLLTSDRYEPDRISILTRR